LRVFVFGRERRQAESRFPESRKKIKGQTDKPYALQSPSEGPDSHTVQYVPSKLKFIK